MEILYFSISFEHFSQSFHHTDPEAWIGLVLAIGSMLAIFASFFSHEYPLGKPEII